MRAFKNMDQKQFMSAVSQIAEEKGIAQDQIIETLEMAIAAAYKRITARKVRILKLNLMPKPEKLKFTRFF